MKATLKSWWVTFRYGSRFTRAGRSLLANLHDPASEYVEVKRPAAASTPKDAA